MKSTVLFFAALLMSSPFAKAGSFLENRLDNEFGLMIIELPLMREAIPGECYPPPYQDKEYLEEKKGFFGRTHVTYTCRYICVTKNWKLEDVIGTHTDKFWNDDGRAMVCEGFREHMVWKSTPMNSKRWGFWDLGKRSPFSAKKARAAEVRHWFKKNF